MLSSCRFYIVGIILNSVRFVSFRLMIETNMEYRREAFTTFAHNHGHYCDDDDEFVTDGLHIHAACLPQ